MSKKLVLYILFCILLLSYANILNGEVSKKISLTLPDLQKYFNLERDHIKLTWSEFKRILEQLGNKIKPGYSIADGLVTLKRSQFDLLLKKMPQVFSENIKPPADYIITNSVYNGNSIEKNSKFILNIRVYIFKSGKYISLPVLSAKSAVSNILIDRKPGLLTVRGNWYYINLKNSGYHDIKISFSIENNKQGFNLPIIRSISTSLDFSLPFSEYQFNSKTVINQITSHSAYKSSFSALFPSSNQISLNWNLKREKIKKKPALFYSKSNSLLSVTSDIIKVKTSIELEILQSSLNKVSVLIPEGFAVINTIGRSINNWALRNTEIGNVLEVNFGSDINRFYRFNINFEKMIKADTLGLSYSGIKVLSSNRETGYLGIISKNEVEVNITGSKEMEKIEYHKIPKNILSMTEKPILYTFKFSKHPYKLDYAINKHKKMEGLSTLIESARAKVLFLEKGKILHRIEYFVRNSYKQFLELELPEGSTLWSVLVNNKREKASSNMGRILIPLLRSSGKGDLLKAFKVVLVYAQSSDSFSINGKREILLPKTDIFLNKVKMDVYVPNGYNYNINKMDWKEVKKIVKSRPVKLNEFEDKKDIAYMTEPKPGKKQEKTKGKVKKYIRDGSNLLKDSDIIDGIEGRVEGDILGDDLGNNLINDDNSKKISEEITVIGKVPVIEKFKPLTGPVGLNSININLPISGQKFSFTKSIINKSESYPIKFSFSNKNFYKTLYYIIGFIFIMILVLFLIFRFRKKEKKQK